MLDKWTGEVVGTAHLYKIALKDLAKETGMSYQALSAYLHCRKKSPSAEPRIRSALLRLIEKQAVEKRESDGDWPI